MEREGHAANALVLSYLERESATELLIPGIWTTRSEMLYLRRRETANLRRLLYEGRERREWKISTVLELSLKIRRRAGTDGKRDTASITETTASASK
jgi:hypothetical protein